ncbi:MAG: 1,4-dihydroxy-2-naphthoate octaprenyltransferase [Anaerolineales bacterium]|jgi:1,4-dihydroxy-2-naphthoate octaprenyltransferase
METSNKPKSVITCDMEGRIETFNERAEQLFGYRKSEVIGKKRVSLFSPGLTVLEHVPNWLKTARETGEYRSRTVFLRKDGTPFAADIRITPTFRDGEQIGYCGVTEELETLDPAEAAPEISLMTKVFAWLVITRAPFLTAIIVPILVAGALVAALNMVSPFPWLNFILALFAGISLHVAANTFNDYFDWKSGADPLNNEYFLPYSGGSRSIELGLINEKTLFRVAVTSLVISGVLGLALTLLSGPGILLFGLIGAFSAYFYTAPPIRLAARRGLGELFTGLNFGPLAVMGAVYAMTGQFSWIAFLAGIPIGLLTAAILWINEFPDVEADRAAGKNTLVATLGRQRARWGYVALLLAAFGIVIYGVLQNLLPIGASLILAGLPLAVYTCVIILREYGSRTLVRANSATIQLHLLAGLLMAAGLLWGERLLGLIGL